MSYGVTLEDRAPLSYSYGTLAGLSIRKYFGFQIVKVNSFIDIWPSMWKYQILAKLKHYFVCLTTIMNILDYS